jgi:hypothetical protein
MSILKWPNDFEWPYAGQPMNVPIQFSRGMVKVEDQIYWLLNGLQRLNAEGISLDTMKSYVDISGAKTLDAANEYTENMFDRFNRLLNELEEIVEGLNSQTAITRNPVTGMNDFIYVALKQMYDLLRPHTITWDELAESGMTWDELADTEWSYYLVEMFGNMVINASDEHRVFFTPASHISPFIPGYYSDVFVHGTTWNELTDNGFLYSRRGD